MKKPTILSLVFVLIFLIKAGFSNGSCTQCSSGEYLLECEGLCFSCLPGHYCDNGINITQCPINTYNAEIGSTSLSNCLTCPDGYYNLELGKTQCTICEMGFSCSGGIKTACPFGKYTDREGLSDCLTCPAGHECPDTDQKPVACDIGSYDNAGTCETCPNGYYSLSKGSTSCNQCEAGYRCSGGNRIICAAGTWSSAGSSSCSNCDSGTYTVTEGSSSCIDCPAGFYCDVSSSLPKECLKGTYSNGGKITSCSPCSTNQYTPTKGAKECMSCPGGSQCDGSDFTVCALGQYVLSNVCTDCPEGYYCMDPSLDKQACPKGTYGTGTARRTSCTACTTGWYSSSTGSGTCTQCPAGKKCLDPKNDPIDCEKGMYSTLGSQVCTPCSKGYIATAKGLSSCTQCTAGYRCPDPTLSEIQCEEGFYSAAGSQICSPCQPGTYSNAGRTACVACEAGYHCGNPRLGRISCPSGYVSTSTSQTKCIECPAGSYCPNSQTISACTSGYSYPGQTSCTSCPPGMDCTDHANPSYCGDGYYSTEGTDGCSICEGGKECFKDLVVSCESGYYSLAGESDCKLCPSGYSCSDSALSPVACSNIEGSAQYSLGGATSCTDCPAGYMCPSVSQVPVICPEGSYSLGGRKTCLQCSAGSSCDQIKSSASVVCPNGYFSFAGMKECIECPPGFECSKVDYSPTACSAGQYSLGKQISCTNCPLGSYCPTPYDAPLPCPMGTYTPSNAQIECTICPAGYYCTNPADTTPPSCPEGTWSPKGSTNCFECSEGYLCPAGSTTPNPAGAICTLGGYCPKNNGLTSRIQCPAGTFGVFSSDRQEYSCEICPAGYTCAQGSTGTTICTAGDFCPAGSSTPIECPKGTYNAATGGKSIDDCTPCPAGYRCQGNGRTSTSNCHSGHYCPVGTDRSIPCPAGTYSTEVHNTAASDCTVCGKGSYCLEGSTSEIACPAGTYNNIEGASSATECFLCPPGYVCPTSGLAIYTQQCTAGHYCPEGSTSEHNCPAGTFTDEVNLHRKEDCEVCREGYFCLEGSTSADMLANVCPAGYYCRGADNVGYYYGEWKGLLTGKGLTEFNQQTKCPAGTFSSSTGLAREDQCTPCTPGKYCIGGETTETGNCSPGYYCPQGSKTSTENACPIGTYYDSSDASDLTNCKNCTEGNYCPEGSANPISCPVGSYSDVKGTKYIGPSSDSSSESCLYCPAGSYCGIGTQNPLPCDPGKYSTSGQETCVSCKAGYYCLSGTSESKMLADYKCDAGKYCPLGSSTVNNGENLCSLGHYCPQNTELEIDCPKGTYGPIQGLQDANSCTDCPAGNYCVQGSAVISGDCQEGYYCPLNSDGPTQIPCPAGTYRSTKNGASVSDCSECPEGFYCPIATVNPISCLKGSYCTAGVFEPTPCPIGTIGNETEYKSINDCIDCDPGSYCNQLGITNVTGECDAGYYCISKAKTSKPIDGITGGLCPRGGYCPKGSFEPTVCPIGTYNNFTGRVSANDCYDCLPGYYCASTSALVPTLKCDAGYYCTGGSTTPTQHIADKGYYTTEGSSQQISCPKGTFSNATGSSSCYTCTEGYYCPNLNTQDPIECSEGYYCPSGSSYQKECPRGTFSNTKKLTDESQCEQCSKGQYCEGTALTTPTGNCLAGFYCDLGSPESAPLEKSYGSICPVGKYCPEGTIVIENCPSGTFNPSLGRKKEADCNQCLPGFYCPSSGLSSVTLPCKAGYYCTAGATVEDPTDGTTGNICPIGSYCPANSAAPIPCPSATYSDTQGRSSCINCPKGSYCHGGNKIDCPTGYYCPDNSASPTLCKEGTFRDTKNAEQESDCQLCSAGKYCASNGNSAVTGDCSEGYFCLLGATSELGEYTTGGNGGICPKGSYCGSSCSVPSKCNAGTFLDSEGNSKIEDCISCTPGKYCATTGLHLPSGNCSEGYYCPGGSTSATDIECPIGQYCPSGSSYPLFCSAGTYQNSPGQTSCLTCPKGSYCLDNSTSPIPCPSGYYCEESTKSITPDIGCPEGTYYDLLSAEKVEDCKPCSGGSYCSIKGLVVPNGVCSKGYYCTDSAIDSLGRKFSGDSEKVCPIGNYCPEGSSSPTKCPKGTFSNKEKLFSEENCQKCTGGKYCDTEGISSVTGDCAAGYYCVLGAEINEPIDGVTGNICPKGHYCPIGSIAPLKCPEGEYQDSTGKSSCKQCTEGYYCPLGTVDPIICPQGEYCEVGRTPTNKGKCPTGSFGASQGLKLSSECTLCLSGEVCSEEALTAPNLKCSIGYYCPEGAKNPLGELGILGGTFGGICPAGKYCPEGSGSPTNCPEGTFSSKEGNFNVSHCIPCKAGYYCPNQGQTKSEDLCPTKYYCPGGQITGNEYPCTIGNYCTSGSIYPTPCENGEYQDEEGKDSCKQCPAGKYCLNGESDPKNCLISSFCPLGTGEPIKCANGTYGSIENLESQSECSNCPAGKYCQLGIIVGDCFAGHICYSQNPTPTPIDDLPKGDYCPIGFYCPQGVEVPVPCPNNTVGTVEGSKTIDVCGLCSAGYVCDELQEITLPDNNYFLLSLPRPCPVGHYCPTAESGDAEPIKCKPGTYNPYEYGKNESSCLVCPPGYLCKDEAMSILTDNEKCKAGHFCIAGTIDTPVPCPVGTYNDVSGGVSLSQSCKKCPPGFYCPTNTTLTPISCPGGKICLEGSVAPRECPSKYYCPAATTNGAITCPGGYYCPVNSEEPIECTSGAYYCPLGSDQSITCPLGWKKKEETISENITLRTSISDACEICPAGKYGTNERNECYDCDAGYVCLAGATTNTPIDLTIHKGYKCTKGNYCPKGSSTMLPCPKGYYQKEDGQGSCDLCPVQHYNDEEGKSYCKVCGSNSLEVDDRTTCKCIGDFRSYQKSDSSCLCYPGYVLYEENVQTENEDSQKDCQAIVYDSCNSDLGYIRNSLTGKCEEKANCIAFCSHGNNQNVHGFISESSGVCECQEVIDENTICDAECRKKSPQYFYDSTSQSFVVKDRSSNSVSSSLGSAVVPTILDSEGNDFDGNYEISVVQLKEDGILGLYDLKESWFSSQFSSETPETPSRRNIYSIEEEETKGVYQPLVCLNYGSALLFTIDCSGELKHYPYYVKDSLLNTNNDFDYGQFRELESSCKSSNANITNFMYVFQKKDYPGVYVFQDAGSPTEMMIVKLMDEETKCPGTATFKPIMNSNLVALGISKDQGIRLAIDFWLILGIICSFVLFLIVLVIAFKYLYSSTVFSTSTITPKYRKKVNILEIMKRGLQSQKMQKLMATKGDALGDNDDQSNLIDLEGFDVEQFYRLLFAHKKYTQTNIYKLKDNFNSLSEQLGGETDLIKNIIIKKYLDSNSDSNGNINGGNTKIKNSIIFKLLTNTTDKMLKSILDKKLKKDEEDKDKEKENKGNSNNSNSKKEEKE